MSLLNLIDREPVPAPWSEGENIPWDDPDFSRRMLKEHLRQDHDAASRKADTIGLWLAGTEGAAFIDELRPGAGETVIYKPRNSAFKGTNLDHLLRERGIRSLIVAEHATNV